MEAFSNLITNVNNVLWGLPMILLLFGTHIFMTIRTGCIQRNILTGIRLSVTKDPDAKGDISPFASLATALASTIGTGNIIGVGTAIALGGPGAVLWCWLTGVFGIATKYAESLIAVKYRVQTKDGRMLGGAMYALERGLHMKVLPILFAVFAVLTSYGIGSSVQVNAIAKVVNTNMGIDTWVVGIVIAIITAVVIFGGVKAISKVCEGLVPIMAIFYVAGCIVILAINYDYIVPAISTICTMAFTPGAAAGGLIGTGIMAAARYGIARGLFSNESGMGSSPIVSAAAQTKNPVRQALVSSTGTFWDTVVVCLMTGLVLVSSIIKNPNIDVSNITDGGELTSLAFGQLPYVGTPILVIGIITFAFSTILGWAYYGERCIEYLAGKRSLIPYRCSIIIVLLIAPMISLNVVWDVADTLNALMAIPNIVAVLLLSKVIAKETKYYLGHDKKGNSRLDEACTDPIPVVDK